MQENGVEIGSHTVDHEPLTGYTPAEQEHQLQESKYILESNGIVAVESFSYPNGKYDAGLPAILQRDGYRSAVTGDAGLNVAATNPYLLQRINIPHPRFGLTEFRLRLWKGEIMARLGIRQHSMEE
jgi:peptidoglycan/xylan/chitin deacetylase (PgdA/CDA1 family)